MAIQDFDLLTTTASDLQLLLTEGQTTSVELVRAYLHEINKNNDYLRAVICTAPEGLLVQTALQLDAERKNGIVRSALHGIPIIVKDNIATHQSLGMDTTAGAFALAGSRPKKSADVVEKLIAAGMIVIGKGNLSELSYSKGEKLVCGWSAVGGQGQTPYVKGGYDPSDTYGGHSTVGSSSSGSAAAVAAGFAPFSLGTETEGSLIFPSNRTALYTIKPTIGLVSTQGIIPVSLLCDSAGPMCKSVLDMANLLDVMVDHTKTNVPIGGYASAMSKDWSQLRVGVLDPAFWKYDEELVKPHEGANKQMSEAFQAAYTKIKTLAKSFHLNVPLPARSALTLHGKNCLETIWLGLYHKEFEEYTSGLEYSPVYTVAEMIDFNLKHAEKVLPPGNANQEKLEKALLFASVTPDMLVEAHAHARKVGRTEGMDKILRDYDLDVIIGPAESSMSAVASASGYPIASLPLGYLDYNGRPFGMAALAGPHQEALLIQLQSAWEDTFGPRQPPPRANFETPIECVKHETLEMDDKVMRAEVTEVAPVSPVDVDSDLDLDGPELLAGVSYIEVI